MRYSEEFRDRVVAENLPPRNRLIIEVCAEYRISRRRFYRRWKKAAKNGRLEHGAIKPSKRPLVEKFALLIEGTRLAEDRRDEWLRDRGLHSEHLTRE